MSKRVKSKAVGDTDSDDSAGSGEQAKVKKTEKAKKAKTGASSSKETDDGSIVFPISGKRQVSVREFKGKIYVDIREFYEDSSGDMKPGRKGISLPVDQWNKLKELVDDIDEAIGKIG